MENATATFQICIFTTPLARIINLEDIEMGMDADCGIKARVERNSTNLTITVWAASAEDAARWLHDFNLI